MFFSCPARPTMFGVMKAPSGRPLAVASTAARASLKLFVAACAALFSYYMFYWVTSKFSDTFATVYATWNIVYPYGGAPGLRVRWRAHGARHGMLSRNRRRTGGHPFADHPGIHHGPPCYLPAHQAASLPPSLACSPVPGPRTRPIRHVHRHHAVAANAGGSTGHPPAEEHPEWLR